jgi:hypothetical protein
MIMNITKPRSAGMAAMALAIVTAFALLIPEPARSAETSVAASLPQPIPQKSFAAPEQAFAALADALKAGDRKTLAAILGPHGTALLHSGDAVEDWQRIENFIAAYAEKHSVVGAGQGRATLVLGDAAWVMPIPAVEGAHGWTLDPAAGASEILARRIGQNELSAIEVARGIVDAQREYASISHDARGACEYAARFRSSKGKRDGLYWETRAGEPFSPLGPFVAQATSEGHGRTPPRAPYHGYYFRLLTAQGKDAAGGARSYAVNGRLIGGFALVAYPAQHGNSGIMTFIVNHDGVVYEKDLGANTSAAARAITAYNPDASWARVTAPPQTSQLDR